MQALKRPSEEHTLSSSGLVFMLASGCPECLSYRISNPKEPLNPNPVPDYPWQIVATDLFQWDEKDYLVVVDFEVSYF